MLEPRRLANLACAAYRVIGITTLPDWFNPGHPHARPEVSYCTRQPEHFHVMATNVAVL